MKARFATISLALAVIATPVMADVSRDDAAAEAQRLSKGRVLSVDKTEAGRRAAWRVKLVTAQGEVRVILIDAATGQPI